MPRLKPPMVLSSLLTRKSRNLLIVQYVNHSNRVTPAEPEVEDSYKSLAEYQAEKEAARVAAQISVRKPNEGVDESQWKKLTPFVKEDKLDESMFSGKVRL